MENKIKNYLRALNINQYYVRIICLIYLRMKNYKYKNESDKRKLFDIFNYQEISKEMKLYPNELHLGNSLYGIEKTLKNYCNYKKKINACIEHGIYFGEYYSKYEIKSGLKNIITLSMSRKEKLNKATSQKVFTVGPYIYYAKLICSSDKINKYKKKIGKTLLFFPTHSIVDVSVDYDIEGNIKEINSFKEKGKYETVIVCLYYNDILQEKHLKYEKEGFKIVTAGHKYDQYFLSRLKTIFELSDEVISNDIGTHTAYSCALNKKYTLINSSDKIKHNPLTNDQKEVFNQMNKESRDKEKKILSDYFENENPIQNRDFEKINYYLGIDQLKERKELFKIISD